VNVIDFPAQDCWVRRLEIPALVHSKHRSIRVEHDRVLVLAHQPKTENVAVERRRFLRVARDQEANHFCQDGHWVLHAL